MERHTRLVNALIEAFKNKGYIISSATLEGYPHPRTIGRHEPDIIAKDQSGLLIIGEAKVGDDLFEQKTKEQLIDFSNRIMSGGPLNGAKIPLHLIVPKVKTEELKQVLANLGLTNKIGDRITIWEE